MTELYALGRVGDPARILIPGTLEQAERQLRADEVAVAVDEPGAWTIASGTAARRTQVVETLAGVEAALLAGIDDEREKRQMTVMTAGGAKKYVYNRKAAEAIDARGLVVGVLNALSLTDKARRFPFAQAEAAQTGEPISTVLTRYETALNVSAATIAAIEAKAQKAKRAVRAATTIAAKRAAANVTWS